MEYWSSNRKFGIVVSPEQMQQILAHCIKAGNRETGGILIGNYSANNSCASISQILGPTQDSKSGRTWFIRGVSGLQKLIDHYWERDRQYYLGEWHFHPYALPDPSGRDIAQMKSIASSKLFNCPEPLLIIMGGIPLRHPLVRIFVFPKGQLMELVLSI